MSNSATTAQSPFDDVNADIVLHTSDHVDFRVLRCILALSSPFFQSMFTLPQPPSSARVNAASLNETPSVDVPEDSLTLDTLLRFLYPDSVTPVHPFHDILHARNVATAASKYTMSAALDRIADRIQTQYIPSHPFEVYFFACRMGWKNVAKAAARCCIRADLKLHMLAADGTADEDALVKSGTLDFLGAGLAYHRLEAYRYACQQRLNTLTTRMSALSRLEAPEDRRNRKAKRGDFILCNQCITRWITAYSENIRQALSKCPVEKSVEWLGLAPKPACSECDIGTITRLGALPPLFIAEVEKALSEVRRVRPWIKLKDVGLLT